jgi:tight adherence protein C
MLDFLLHLMRPETLITILIGMATFSTVLTLAAPYLQNDELRQRMKRVADERERLRASQRAQFSGNEAKLRDRRQGSLAWQFANALKLRQVFEADNSRDLLRQAGLRSENHLVTFLALRIATPVLFAGLAYVYSTAVVSEEMPLHMRMAITVGAAIAGFYLPLTIVKNLIARRQISIKGAWSDALDLMLICVESGMAIEPALQRVAREIGTASVPLAEELTLTVAELSYLQDRRKAFENLAKRTGLPTVKSVVTSLIQSERYGTPLGTALRVLAQENRDARMFEAERKAAALPPRLTVPMIVFFLPVIFIVILGPSAIAVMNLR